jgi:CRP-like cAMP-binding protein
MLKDRLFPLPTANQLLSRLPECEYQHILPRLQPVALELGAALDNGQDLLDHAYFLTQGVVSALMISTDGSAIEVASIGREGMLGLVNFPAASSYRLLVQVPGSGLRIHASALLEETCEGSTLRHLLARYQAAFLRQVLQSVACNGLHSIRQRCCRWLLVTRDRVGSDEVPLTHERLALMLGVRRSSVTESLRPLKDEGAIRYTRGKITILDGERLEGLSCECYRLVAEAHERLLRLTPEVMPGAARIVGT